MNKHIAICTLCLLIGFFSGKHSKPDKTTETVKETSQQRIIEQLQSKIKTLSEENIKTKTVTVIVEKPDGTKTTTKTKDTEKLVNKYSISKKDNRNELSRSKSLESEKVTINNLKSNAIGVKYFYNVNTFNMSPEPYIKAGMKCFLFNCYAEASYIYTNQNIKAAVGIELRF